MPLLPDRAQTGGGAAVFAGATIIFCVGTAVEAGPVVAMVVAGALPTIAVGALVGASQPGG